jgi:Acyclic terpene utilisation family protein AtuA
MSTDYFWPTSCLRAMTEFRILANCMVGLGFSRRAFAAGLKRSPHLIGCDGGSADFGPAFLGSGKDSKSLVSVRRDLQIMIKGAREIGVPLVIASAGGAGADSHLDGYRKIVKSIAADDGLHFRAALIHAEQPRERLHAALDAGQIAPLGATVPALTHAAIDASNNIVAMMGAGPIRDALEDGADVILAGRCADPAIFAAPAIMQGAPSAQAWHAGKCVDKGYLATEDPSRGASVLASIREDHFDVEAMNDQVRCTVQTVARTATYENPNPFRIPQPNGVIDVSDATYEQIGNVVRVRGSRFDQTDSVTVKLEGAGSVGYRAMLIAGIRDPRLLERLPEFLVEYRRLLEQIATSLGISPDDWRLEFRTFGHDAVLGEREPQKSQPPREVGLVVDVVAKDQDLAAAIAGRAGPTGSRLHVGGGLGSGGNFAYPFSPSTLRAGEVFEWTVWHTLEVADETSPFPIEMVEF